MAFISRREEAMVAGGKQYIFLALSQVCFHSFTQQIFIKLLLCARNCMVLGL